MKIIVTIFPTNLATSLPSFLFSAFVKNQKKESNFHQVGGLVIRNSFAFCL